MENFKIIGREGYNMARAIKGGHVHQGEQSHSEHEHWEEQPATLLEGILHSIPELKISK